MSYQPKEGNGALFKNDKADNPARPDYRGDLMVGGVLYEVSAWIKPLPSDASKRFLSLAAKPKQARQNDSSRRSAAGAQRSNQSRNDRDDSDIPF